MPGTRPHAPRAGLAGPRPFGVFVRPSGVPRRLSGPAGTAAATAGRAALGRPVRPVLALALAAGLVAGCAAPPPRDPDRILADARTSARVRAALLADPLVGGSALTIDVDHGVATVGGAVPDEATGARALQIVRETPGVGTVVSRLVVGEPSASGAAQ